MSSIKATIREKTGKQNRALREDGVLPAVLYGEAVKSTPVEVSEKDFVRVYTEAGESSLVSLELGSKKYDVLIHQIAKDPLTGSFIHVDFYRPSTKKKVEAEIPLVFEGESIAVKDMDGILVRGVQSLEVKGLAHNLPREIIVNVEALGSFEDRIYVKDLKVPEGVEVRRDKDDIVALVVAPKEEKEEEEAAPATKGEETPAEGEAVEAEGAEAAKEEN